MSSHPFYPHAVLIDYGDPQVRAQYPDPESITIEATFGSTLRSIRLMPVNGTDAQIRRLIAKNIAWLVSSVRPQIREALLDCGGCVIEPCNLRSLIGQVYHLAKSSLQSPDPDLRPVWDEEEYQRQRRSEAEAAEREANIKREIERESQRIAAEKERLDQEIKDKANEDRRRQRARTWDQSAFEERLALLRPHEIECFYHTTHISNIPSIRTYGLLSRNALDRGKYVDVADKEVMRRREEYMGYVPLYFAESTPMWFVLRKKYCRRNLFRLRVHLKAIGYWGAMICCKNAASRSPTAWWESEIRKIEWPIVKGPAKEARDFRTHGKIDFYAWNDWKRHRMAEVLVPDRIPPEMIDFSEGGANVTMIDDLRF